MLNGSYLYIKIGIFLFCVLAFQESLSSPLFVPETFIGIPYEPDGAVDEAGRWTYFAKPNILQKGKGLNCSGFVLELSRFLLERNFTLEEVTVDNFKNSGDGSPYGTDWDFGWDLILNISKEYKRTLFLPGYKSLPPETFMASNSEAMGFALHKTESWNELRNRFKPYRLYLISFNRCFGENGCKIQHYHVGVIYPDEKNIWFYNTTSKNGKSYKRNLSSPKDFEQFLKAFADTKNSIKHIAVMEVIIESSQDRIVR